MLPHQKKSCLWFLLLIHIAHEISPSLGVCVLLVFVHFSDLVYFVILLFYWFLPVYLNECGSKEIQTKIKLPKLSFDDFRAANCNALLKLENLPRLATIFESVFVLKVRMVDRYVPNESLFSKHSFKCKQTDCVRHREYELLRMR